VAAAHRGWMGHSSSSMPCRSSPGLVPRLWTPSAFGPLLARSADPPGRGTPAGLAGRGGRRETRCRGGAVPGLTGRLRPDARRHDQRPARADRAVPDVRADRPADRCAGRAPRMAGTEGSAGRRMAAPSSPRPVASAGTGWGGALPPAGRGSSAGPDRRRRLREAPRPHVEALCGTVDPATRPQLRERLAPAPDQEGSARPRRSGFGPSGVSGPGPAARPPRSRPQPDR
jgi:hypothetical protein